MAGPPPGSLANLVTLAKVTILTRRTAKGGKGAAEEYIDIVLIAMHGRICEVLDIWGLEAPPDADAAQVFALSGSPEHRLAARVFCGSDQAALDGLFKPASGLMVFKNMSLWVRPGLNELWREHIK